MSNMYFRASLLLVIQFPFATARGYPALLIQRWFYNQATVRKVKVHPPAADLRARAYAMRFHFLLSVCFSTLCSAPPPPPSFPFFLASFLNFMTPSYRSCKFAISKFIIVSIVRVDGVAARKR